VHKLLIYLLQYGETQVRKFSYHLHEQVLCLRKATEPNSETAP
jgi:hypothetical protein